MRYMRWSETPIQTSTFISALERLGVGECGVRQRERDMTCVDSLDPLYSEIFQVFQAVDVVRIGDQVRGVVKQILPGYYAQVACCAGLCPHARTRVGHVQLVPYGDELGIELYGTQIERDGGIGTVRLLIVAFGRYGQIQLQIAHPVVMATSIV